MTQDTGEGLKPIDAKPISWGGWTTPFENYDNIPYVQPPILDRWKKVRLRVPEENIFEVNLTRASKALEEFEENAVPAKKRQQENQEEVLVVLPVGARVIQRYEIPEVEKEFETRLLYLGISLDEPRNDVNSTVKLPSGEELKMESSIHQSETFYHGGFFRGKSFKEILIPDMALIAERVELKVDR